jgi:hypothetical protein
MAYSVTTSDGSTAITVSDQVIDSSKLSLALVGRNAVNYGESVLRNTVRHLENFSNTVPPNPVTVLTGQLWYNKTDGTMRVYDGAVWKRMTNIPVSSTQISGNLSAGTAYFNSTTSTLKVYNGVTFKDSVVPGGTITAQYAGNVSASGNAQSYGSKVETLFLTNSADDTVIPVLAVKYVSDATTGGFTGVTPDPAHNNANATILALFSDRDFTVKNTDNYYTELVGVNSIGASIKKGLNLRSDGTSTTAEFANKATWADYANAIYTGSYIAATNIIHTGRGYIPSIGSAYNLGNATNRFGELHVDQATVYNSLRAVNAPNIGNVGSPFGDAFISNLSVSGSINGRIGTISSPITDLYVSNIYISGIGEITTAPTNANSLVNKAYVDTQISTATITATQLRTVSTATNTSHFLTFVDSNNGTLTAESMYTDAGISYNPSTDNLTVAGSITASAFNGTATTSNVATAVTLVATNTTDATHFPLFSSAATGNVNARTDTGFFYNPSSGVLTSTQFSGNLVGTNATLSTVTISGLGEVTSTPSTANSIANKAYVDGQISTATITANQVRTISNALSASFFLTFVDSNNGTLTAESLYTDAGISFNPSTNNLTVTGGITSTALNSTNVTISGVGLITTAPTTANSIANKAYVDTQIANVSIAPTQVQTVTRSVSASHFLTFVDSDNPTLGAESLYTDAGISFNPSTNNLTVTGDVFADDFDTTSDATLKENVVTIASALDKVMAMRGVNYNRIGRDRLELGLIAQEVKQVVPEVVGQNEDGKLTVSYGNLVGLLIEAIKELSAEIQQLKSDK